MVRLPESAEKLGGIVKPMSKRNYDEQPLSCLHITFRGGGGKSRLFSDSARVRFFDTVGRLAPQVQEALRSDVWPAYRRTIENLIDDGVISSRWDAHYFPLKQGKTFLPHADADAFTAWYGEACSRGDPSVAEFHTAMESWLDRYHIRAGWVLQTAIRTMRVWEHYPKDPEDTTWYEAHVLESEENLRTPTKNLEVPLPPVNRLLSETKAEIREHYLEAFEKVLRDHLDRIEEEALERSLPIMREKFEFEKHIEWLVRFQVLEESWNSIANSSGCDKSTVQEAVRPLLDFLGLEERPPTRGGRPKGAKDLHSR